MDALNPQTLEVKDFSGGITDFFFLGDSKRYKVADNFLIGVDRDLSVRPGSIGFDYSNGNHRISGGRRIDSFGTFDDGSTLFVNIARDVYYLNSTPTWTKINGPSGNEAIGGGDSYNFCNFQEFNKHTYVTSDGGAIPSKIYKDTSGNFQVLTMGLPLPKSTPKYMVSSLIAKMLTLANEIRTSMISHINDDSLHPINSSFYYLQPASGVDQYSLCYLQSQTFPSSSSYSWRKAPTTLPTAAPAATDEASLYTLLYALNKVYERHAYNLGVDSTELTNTVQAHHYYKFFMSQMKPAPSFGPGSPKGPAKLLNDTSLLSTKSTSSEQLIELKKAAAQLDELKKLWNFHILSLFTHSHTNDFGIINKYQVVTSDIGYVDVVGVPQITENYSDLIRYANHLKNAWNLHVTNGLYGSDLSTYSRGATFRPHGLRDQTDRLSSLTLPSPFLQRVTIKDASTLNEALILIYHISVLYSQMHYVDSNNNTHTNFTADSTSGSANLTNVKDLNGAAITLPVGSTVIYTFTLFTDSNTDGTYSARVDSSGSGTATLNKKVGSTNTTLALQYSYSIYHSLIKKQSTTNPDTSYQTSTTTFSLPGDEELTIEYGPTTYVIPTTIQGWVDLAKNTFFALFNHVQNTEVHFSIGNVFNSLLDSVNGSFFTPDIDSYGYAFTFENTYTVSGGVEFQNISEPIYLGPFETCKIYPEGYAPGNNLPDVLLPIASFGYNNFTISVATSVVTPASVSISYLPILSNDITTNYNTSTSQVQIYRTIDNGTNYYLCSEVSNGTTSYTDINSDSLGDSLDSRQLLYTTGGVVPNTQTPNCKFLHFLKDTAYYAYITESGQEFKNRIIQGISSSDGAPATFFDDLPDEITGISSNRNVIIVFCKNSIYRLSGGFNLLGQGNLIHEKISNTTGCISNASIVQTELGVFFAANDGFYYTDGYQVIKISLDLDESYQKRTAIETQRKRICGTYDNKNRRIYWAMQENPSSSDNDHIWIYHVNYGVKPSGAFTTMSNLTHFKPSAIKFFDGNLIRGDARGLLFKHDSIYLTDPKVPSDTSTSYSSWGYVYIPWDYQSCALDFGSTSKGQWVTKIHLIGSNKGNVNIQTYSVADNNVDSSGKRTLAPIRFDKNIRWGDATINWGDDTSLWSYSGKLDHWRRFTSRTLRSQVKQIQFKPAYVGIYRYDDFPSFSYVTIDASAKTAVLAQPTGYTQNYWPRDVVDYYIAFETDNYVNEYLVTAISNATITFSDASNLSVSGSSKKWVIRGYQKEEKLNLHAYNIHFTTFGLRGLDYPGKQGAGENV